MKIRIFVLRKFVKRTENIIFSLVFVCFRLTEISYFLNFPSNENARKQYLSANAYSCVNMKFQYMITLRKVEILYVVLVRKQAIFHQRLSQLFVTIYKRKGEICYVVLQLKQAIGQLFVEDVHIFPLIFCRKRDRRVEDLFFLLYGNKCQFITINLIKICSQKLGY